MNKNYQQVLNSLISLSVINSFNYKNSHTITKCNKIILTFNISDAYIDATSVFFPKTLWLLEHIGLQKGYVVKLKTIRFGRNQRRVIFSSQVVLRNSNLVNFIYIYFCFIIHLMFRKFLSYNHKIDRSTGDYCFLIKDINVYPGFFEDFFKWFYPLVVNVVMNHFDVLINQHVLQEFGFNFS